MFATICFWLSHVSTSASMRWFQALLVDPKSAFFITGGLDGSAERPVERTHPRPVLTKTSHSSIQLINSLIHLYIHSVQEQIHSFETASSPILPKLLRGHRETCLETETCSISESSNQT